MDSWLSTPRAGALLSCPADCSGPWPCAPWHPLGLGLRESGAGARLPPPPTPKFKMWVQKENFVKTFRSKLSVKTFSQNFRSKLSVKTFRSKLSVKTFGQNLCAPKPLTISINPKPYTLNPKPQALNSRPTLDLDGAERPKTLARFPQPW